VNVPLFTGYVKESHIDVYAKNKGKYSNINYCIVNSFDNIDFFLQDDILCSSTTQAINDILSEDEWKEIENFWRKENG